MIIDSLIDLQYALVNGDWEGFDVTEEIKNIKTSDNFGYIIDAVKTNNNDKIRKALRRYLKEERYNKRYYKVIRETDWVLEKFNESNLVK